MPKGQHGPDAGTCGDEAMIAHCTNTACDELWERSVAREATPRTPTPRVANKQTSRRAERPLEQIDALRGDEGIS